MSGPSPLRNCARRSLIRRDETVRENLFVTTIRSICLGRAGEGWVLVTGSSRPAEDVLGASAFLRRS